MMPVAETLQRPEADGLVESRSRSGSVAAFHDLPKRWHRDRAKLLASGDPQAADAEMREHVRYALDDVLRRLEAGQPLGELLS